MEQSIVDIIRYLLPLGSRGDNSGIIEPPRWPPDLFAVASYLVEKSDCYCELLDIECSDSIGQIIASCQESMKYSGELLGKCPDIEFLPDTILEEIRNDWNTLIDCQSGFLYNKVSTEGKPAWIAAALRLLILADNACEGIGFYRTPKQNLNESPENTNSDKASDIAADNAWIMRVYDWMGIPDTLEKLQKLYQHNDWYKRFGHYISGLSNRTIDNKSAAVSACIMIPQDRLCVQPKALTPTVGCTIRSLTKNLSLHPGIGQIQSRWFNHAFEMATEHKDKLNILVVPFPYRIASDCFTSMPSATRFRTFHVKQTWLEQVDKILYVTKKLMSSARKECRPIDILVFPELSFDQESFDALKEMVAGESQGRFTMIVGGVSKEDNGRHVNSSTTAYIDDNAIQVENDQRKHHRWKLDDTQIKTYALEACLHHEDTVKAMEDITGNHSVKKKANNVWWEETALGDRKVDYHVFQEGACFATLICEDLARQDPCKPSIQAIGPNLVFALLMDASQLSARWPGRYTLGLTEDPGSAVLTVTSLGLVERSNWAHNASRQTIALWGNRHGVREIDLPPEHHAMLLSLMWTTERMSTLDNRDQLGTSWHLTSMIPMRVTGVPIDKSCYLCEDHL